MAYKWCTKMAKMAYKYKWAKPLKKGRKHKIFDTNIF